MREMYKITKITLDDISETNIDSELFSSPCWLSVYRDIVTFYGIFDNNEMIAYFGYYVNRLGPLSIIKSLPFSPCIAFKILRLPQNKSNILSTQKKIVEIMAEHFKSLHKIVSIAFHPNVNDLQPFIWKKFKVTARYTYQINLENGYDFVKKNMSVSRRNDISKAIKDAIDCQKCFDHELIRSLATATLIKKNIKADGKLIQSIITNTMQCNKAICYVSWKDGTPLAMAFCVFDLQTVYYLLGWYNKDTKHHGAGALCIFRCIEEAMALGLKKFDFEGSMIPEIENYFRGFGGDIVPYFVASYAPLPLEIALKLVKREIF